VKKKILITCLYPSEANPLLAIEMAKSLMALGFEVYGLLETGVINKKEWIDLLGVNKIEYISISHFTRKLSKYTKYINALRYSVLGKKTLFSKFYNIVFDYTFYSFYHHWNDIIIRKIDSKKNVLFLHDPIPHSGEPKKRLKNQKHQVSLMDDTVLLSKKFIPTVEKEYGVSASAIHYMPLGAMDYSNGNHVEPVKFDENSGIHFLFFGRIQEYKGIDILLKAFSKIKKMYPDTTLTIAGNGDFSVYEQLISGTEEILNRYIDDSEISGLFSETNTVVVLPYADATQSGVIPIASQYGNPVIASKTGGLVEQLDDGNLGIFVDSGNIDSLLAGMERAITDRKALKEQSNAMIKYHDSLDWNVIVRNLMIELEQKT